jgi:molybdopterin-guanine dinucleotide biosynthesis protein B
LKMRPAANGHGKPVIFQIAGFSNSGKTTFVSKLVKVLSAENCKVVTIKHHGHGGRPEVPDQKDSTRHIASGAAASLVQGGGRIVLQAEKEEWPLLEQIELLSFFKPDIILIEGYKHADFPKAVFVRDHHGAKHLSVLDNVVAVYYWERNVLAGLTENRPCFHINDETGLSWLKDYLLEMVRQ